MNDTVYYQWTGTLPSNLDAYKTYWYQFTDTLPKGISFNNIEQVYVSDSEGTSVNTFMDVTDDVATNDTLPEGITCQTVAGAGTTVVTMEFNDLKTLYTDIAADNNVVVTYSCTITSEALVAEANTNKVYLEYSNNPNADSTGDSSVDPDNPNPDTEPSDKDKGKTVEAVAHAFTFKITVDKFDSADVSNKLSNVSFILYNESDDEGQEEVNYAIVTDGAVSGWTTDKSRATVLNTNSNGAFDVKGLDAGIYYLEEIATVDGYNMLSEPVEIEIIPTYTVNGNVCSVTMEYLVDGDSQGDEFTISIGNSKGTTLPSTGGDGIKLLYTIGGMLLLVAVVFLVTGKRMKKSF